MQGLEELLRLTRAYAVWVWHFNVAKDLEYDS